MRRIVLAVLGGAVGLALLWLIYRSGGSRVVYSNEQVYEIEWDERGRPVRVTVHREVWEH